MTMTAYNNSNSESYFCGKNKARERKQEREKSSQLPSRKVNHETRIIVWVLSSVQQVVTTKITVMFFSLVLYTFLPGPSKTPYCFMIISAIIGAC